MGTERIIEWVAAIDSHPKSLYAFVQCHKCNWVGPVRDLAVSQCRERLECPECESARVLWIEPMSQAVH